jgi:hypothetical protein
MLATNAAQTRIIARIAAIPMSFLGDGWSVMAGGAIAEIAFHAKR